MSGSEPSYVIFIIISLLIGLLHWLYMNQKRLKLEDMVMETINKNGIIKFKDVAKECKISPDDVKRVIRKLIIEGRIQGFFTSDGEGFITEGRLMEEIGREIKKRGIKCVKFKEEADRLNVPVRFIIKAFEKSLNEEKIYGIIDAESKEFIHFSPQEIENLAKKLLETKRIPVKELANELNLTMDQMHLVIDKLLSEKIKGLYTQDGTLISNSLVINLAIEVSKKTGKLDVYEVSQRLSVPVEKVVEVLSDHVINTVAPYKRIRLVDLSRETGLPEDFLLPLLKRLISKGKLSGSIDMIYRTFTREIPYKERVETHPPLFEEVKRAKPSALWFLVPLFFGIIGGLIAYVAVKDEDREMAKTLLHASIIWSVIVFFIIIALHAGTMKP